MGTEVAVHIQAIGVGQASIHVRIELEGQNRISRASPSSREVKHTLSALLEHWINPVCTVAQPSLCGIFHGGCLGTRRPRRSTQSRYPAPSTATTRLSRSAASHASCAYESIVPC